MYTESGERPHWTTSRRAESSHLKQWFSRLFITSVKKAAIYVRVSTPDQHVESQLYDLREFAAQRSFEVAHEYEDRGVCGQKARRPGLELDDEDSPAVDRQGSNAT